MTSAGQEIEGPPPIQWCTLALWKWVWCTEIHRGALACCQAHPCELANSKPAELGPHTPASFPALIGLLSSHCRRVLVPDWGPTTLTAERSQHYGASAGQPECDSQLVTHSWTRRDELVLRTPARGPSEAKKRSPVPRNVATFERRAPRTPSTCCLQTPMPWVGPFIYKQAFPMPGEKRGLTQQLEQKILTGTLLACYKQTANLSAHV